MTRRPPLAVALPAGIAALIAVAPIWYLADRALAQGWAKVADELWQRRTLDLVLRSLGLAAVVTVLCSLIGITAAWLVERSDLPGRRWLRVAFALPLAVPSYLAAFAWTEWQDWVEGFRGAVLVLTLVSYPYVYLPVAATLRHLDPAHEEVARSLGVSPWAVVRRITLPQIRTTASAGALLVALYVLSDFGAVATMRYEAFTWVIYGAYRAGFNPAQAAILASVLVLVATVLVTAEAAARGRATSRLGSGVARRTSVIALGPLRSPALLFVALVLGAGIGFPLIRVVHWIRTFASTSVDVGSVGAALLNTVWFGLLAAVATIVLSLPVGLLAARWKGRSTTIIERSTYISHALPGIVVAISLVFVGVRTLRPIYQEVPLVILGYVVLFLPLGVGAVRAAIEQTPQRIDEVARSLGARPFEVFIRVTLPLAAPGVAAGAAMVLLTAMKELPVTLILRPTGTETLATQLWQYTAVSDYANAGPYALALVLFAAVPTAALSMARDGRR